MKRLGSPLLGIVCLVALVACGGGGTPGGGRGAISGTLIYPGSVSPNAAVLGPAISNPDDPIIDTTIHPVNTGRPLEVVPGEVLVRFRGDVSAQALDRLQVEGAELTAVRTLGQGDERLQLYRTDGLDQTATLALVDSLRSRGDVAAAYPNWVLYSFKTPNDPGYPLQWHYDAINLSAAWDTEDGVGANITVAVVDTGVVPHPDLFPNLLKGYDFISDPTLAGDGDGRDDNPFDEGGNSDYHGSHVAGTVAAVTNNGVGVAGVSWGAKVVPVRALGVTGGGSFADIFDGIEWAAGRSVQGVPNNPNPAQIINLSLGGDIEEPCPAEINRFFQSLANEGVIVVAAAGNETIDAATVLPASCDGVIAVGATGPQNTRAPYSNYGSTIDVMAPGGDVSQSFTVGGETYPAGVLSTVAQPTPQGLQAAYAFYPGTSMASPHVAGIVALMLAQTPGLGFDEVLSRLQDAATPLSASACGRPSGGDCGAGLVDAAAALGGSGGTPPPPPPTDNLTTYVAGLYCLQGCNNFDLDRSVLVEVDITSDAIPFNVPGLEPGTYVAAAWQDVNQNSNVDNGEPFGVYAGPGGNRAITVTSGQTVTNIIIVMQPLAASSQAASALDDTSSLTQALAQLTARQQMERQQEAESLRRD